MPGRPRGTSQSHPSPTHHEPPTKDSSAFPRPRPPLSLSRRGRLEHTNLHLSIKPRTGLLRSARTLAAGGGSHPPVVTVVRTVTGPASSAAPINSRLHTTSTLYPTSTPVAPSVSTPFCVVSARATLRCASAGSGTVRRWDSLRRMRSDLSWHSRVRSSPVRTQRLGWSLLHLRYQVQ